MSRVVSKFLILYERVTSPNKLTEVKIRLRIQKVAVLFTFYMVKHYLDIKRKQNFNSKDTMSNFQNKIYVKMTSFGKIMILKKIPLSLTIFVRYFSLNISSGSLLAFLFAPLVRF